MRYTKPHYYDAFACLAGDCPDTCCAGWQICIDENSLKRYAQVGGSIGSRVANSIDWEEGTFLQHGRDCAFLNEEKLCDLYMELGPDFLCDTCRMYPRHVEEFDGLREMTLSLSCPEAARMILTCKEPVRMISWETEEEDDSFEDGEMDYLFFTRLEDAREVIVSILQDRRFEVEVRMEKVLSLAEEMQRCVEDGVEYEMDDLLERYREEWQVQTISQAEMIPQVKKKSQVETIPQVKTISQVQVKTISQVQVKTISRMQGIPQAKGSKCDEPRTVRYERCCQEYAILLQMERLRPEWDDVLQQMWNLLYADGEAAYQEICCAFDAFLGESSEREQLRQQIGEQLMLFFIQTYFCGAVYDGEIAAKVRLADFSVRWIQELVLSRWVENRRLGRMTLLSMEEVIELAWCYAREVEHSDVNLEILEDALR